ncbi:Rh-like protein/ammonium transporter [Zopfia rhizophila CBS 207.26]|uniref:Rh-like protein/ammonium transporter n=1 Tax=Zopfia rhizophila CBS 207.26 TaxID=1314779 RepID=A0A6A6END9_9PEZI|nr:Rh-like protein/ammonium transporter [Zopfia rhizophila CBS 207.26]
MMELYQFGQVPAPKSTMEANLSEIVSHPELYYEGADIAMMITASALVFLMIPGIALVYSGVADCHSTVTLARIPLITTAFIGFQWYLWGYTLTFSPSISVNDSGHFAWYGGDPKTNVFRDVLARPVGIQGPGPGPMTGPKIPELVFALYQGMFACFTASIVSGGIMKKALTGRFLLFISLWSLLVYNPIARWTWHPQGWSRIRGAMDFAGGTAVHVCSGATVAAYSIFFQLEVRGWKFRNLWNSRWRRDRRARSAEQNASNISGKDIPLGEIQSDDKTTAGPSHAATSEARSRGQDDRVEGQSSSGTTESQSTNETHHINGPRSRSVGEAQNDQRRRRREDILDLEMRHLEEFTSHNVTNAVLGTTLLWFGWFGFNGGSALGSNLRAASACLATHIAACAGGSAGLLMEWVFAGQSKYLKKRKKYPPSILGFCDGAIAGLVAITPAAGFVPVKLASIFGIVAAIICKVLRFYVRPRLLPYDNLDICAVHAGGGFVGMLLTAFLASDEVTGLDGYSRLVSRTTGQRVRNQLLDVSAGFFYSFAATFVILLGLKFLRFLFHRADKVDMETRAVVIKDKLVALPQHNLCNNM